MQCYCCCCSIVGKSCLTLWPHGLWPTRLLCAWDFPGKSNWSGLPFPSPEDLPDPEIKPVSPTSPALSGRFFTTELPGKATECKHDHKSKKKKKDTLSHNLIKQEFKFLPSQHIFRWEPLSINWKQIWFSKSMTKSRQVMLAAFLPLMHQGVDDAEFTSLNFTFLTNSILGQTFTLQKRNWGKE